MSKKPCKDELLISFLFSYERFENALICIISFLHSTRFGPISNFPIFGQNGVSLKLLNIVFENNLPKEFFVK